MSEVSARQPSPPLTRRLTWNDGGFALTARMLRRAPRDLLLLAVYLAVTAMFGKPFTKLHVPGTPVYVTEVVIVAVIVLTVRRRTIGDACAVVARSLPWIPLLVFWLAGAVATIRGVSGYGVHLTLHDVGLVEYSILLPIVALVADTRASALLLVRTLYYVGLVATVAFLVLSIVAPSSRLAVDDPAAAIAVYLALLALGVAARVALRQTVPVPELVATGAALILISMMSARSLVVALIAALAGIVILAPWRRAVLVSIGALVLSVGGAVVVAAAGISLPVAAVMRTGQPPPAPTVTTPAATTPVAATTSTTAAKPTTTTTPASTTSAQPTRSQPTTTVAAAPQAPAPAPPSIVNVTKDSFNASTAGGANIRWRIAYWEELLRRTRHDPLLGVGFGRPAAFRWHGLLYDARVGNALDPNDVTPPHNSFVNILYRTGLLGLVPLLLLLAAAGIAVRRALSVGGTAARPDLVILVAFFAFACTIAFFNAALEGPYIGVFFWTALGLLLVLPKRLGEEPEAQKQVA